MFKQGWVFWGNILVFAALLEAFAASSQSLSASRWWALPMFASAILLGRLYGKALGRSASMSTSSKVILACPQCKSADDVCGVEIRGVYDGVLFWQCMWCGSMWHRYHEDHFLRGKAQAEMDRLKANQQD